VSAETSAAPAATIEAVTEAPTVREDAPKRDRGPREDRRRDRNDKARNEGRDQPRMERSERSDRTGERSEKRDRPGRDYKRKDDDLILDPAPEKVKGFGADIPSFLKKR